MLTLLLNYRISTDVNYGGDTIIINRWGFQEGGKYSVQISNASVTINSLLFMLCDKTEFTNLTRSGLLMCTDAVNTCKVSSLQPVYNLASRWNATVPKTAHYYSIIINCNARASVYTLDANFSNPKSKLSTDQIPCLYIKPIMTFLFGIGLVYWIINWIIHFKGTSALHIFYTVAIVFSFLYIGVEMIYYYHFHVSDVESGATESYIVFKFLWQFLLVSGLAFVSQGYGFMNQAYTTKNILYIVLLSAVTIAALSAYNYIVTFNYVLIIFIILVFVVAFYFLLRLILVGVHDALMTLRAHIYVICKEGIDPTTTPLMKKLMTYQVIIYAILGYFGIIITQKIVFTLFLLPDAYAELINDVANLVMVYGVIYMFRLHKQNVTGYQTLQEVGMEVQEFTRDQVMDMDLYEVMQNATTPWDGSTPLPPQPRIVDVPSVSQDFVEEIQAPPTIETNDAEEQPPQPKPKKDEPEIENQLLP